MKAYKNRSWGVGANPFVLNVEEIATLWHFPAIGIKAPLIKKQEARKAEPPVGLPITFEENTLPGFEEDAQADPDFDHLPSPPPGADLPSGDDVRQPLEESLPNVPAPTDAPESDPKNIDDGVPTNLPI